MGNNYSDVFPNYKELDCVSISILMDKVIIIVRKLDQQNIEHTTFVKCVY